VVPKLCSANPKAFVTSFQGIRGYISNGYYEMYLFQNNRDMTVVRLSALRIDRLYPPGNFPAIHFC